MWFEEVVKVNCQGKAYLCRYADDFVCAFQYESEAKRFYDVLGKRLACYGLEIAEDKTRLMRFSGEDRTHRGAFEFLGFEYRRVLNAKRKPVIRRRTARKKYRAALANFKDWSNKHCRLPKRVLFAKLNRKLRGYFNYYGLRGNYESIGDFFYQIKGILFQSLNRRSQRKSYTWKGFAGLLNTFQLVRPRICHKF